MSALIINGPQGSGKTEFARWIAEKIGSYEEMRIDEARDTPTVYWTDTLIVDDCLPTDYPSMKQLVDSNPTVNFIFCASAENVGDAMQASEERRFILVNINGVVL